MSVWIVFSEGERAWEGEGARRGGSLLGFAVSL